MFCGFDAVNETPVDLILKTWTYEEISEFLGASSGK